MSLAPTQQQRLLGVARESIADALRRGAREPGPIDAREYAPPLREVRASFVTLQAGGRLRGCIGSLEATRPLVCDVHAHACAAAFADPRFPPLEAHELAGLDVSISVLSAHTPLSFESEAHLLRQLRVGIDGVVLALEGRRGTFLPSVWQTLSDPATFLAQLKRKAGIPADAHGYQAWRYTAEKIPS